MAVDFEASKNPEALMLSPEMTSPSSVVEPVIERLLPEVTRELGHYVYVYAPADQCRTSADADRRPDS